MHRNILQLFLLVGFLSVVLSVISFTTPKAVTVNNDRRNATSSPLQAILALPRGEPAGDLATPDVMEQPISTTAPESRRRERPASGPLRLIEEIQPATLSAVDTPAASPPPPTKPAIVTTADVVNRLDHASCKLPAHTKALAKQNLAAVGNLDQTEANRVWDTFDEFCRRDFSLFYEIQKSEDLARSRPAPETSLPNAEALEGITLSPEAFRQVEEFVSSVWQAQGYNSEFPGEGVLKPRSDGALGAAIPVATAPLGVQCGGRTTAPQGLGPNWWTCKCTGCCIPCGLGGCCLPSCELGCRPYAYLWDSITGICGCGL
ncbi:hypothetical protein HYW67_01105 [Candidatus Parcubacteria bacterium]|nr:hypothetical protein [Candidatus Parcubacteria bacterium]